MKKTRKPKTTETLLAEKTESAADETIKTDAVKQDEQMKDESVEKDQDAAQDQDDTEPEPGVKHVMFETDNYINCLNTAVWFG